MGARGKGAITQPKEAKNKGGRPRNTGHKPSILKARKLMPSVFARMTEILSDDEADRRHWLRASEILSTLANMQFEEQTEEAADNVLTVEFKRDWGKTGTEGG